MTVCKHCKPAEVVSWDEPDENGNLTTQVHEPREVELCSLHASASDLLEACQESFAIFEDFKSSAFLEIRYRLARVIEAAKQPIKS